LRRNERDSEEWKMLAIHALRPLRDPLRPLREPSPPPWAWDTYPQGKSTDIVPLLVFELWAL